MIRWLLLLVTITAHGADKDLFRLKRFEVREATGKSLVWEPWASAWQPVAKGDRLWERTLVQVTPGASLRMSLETGGDKVEITLDKPIVVRLDEDVLRRITLSPFFASDLPEKIPDGPVTTLAYKSISEAWDRFSYLLSKTGMKPDWLRKPAALEPDASLAIKPKRIVIRTPVDGSTVVADKVPHEIRVSWLPVPDPAARYEVRVWRFDENRPGPEAFTRGDHQFVKVRLEGMHFIQVSTVDGKWQSGLQRVFVALPIGGRISRAVPPNLITNILLRLPPRNFTYFASAFPVTVGFEWQPPSPLISGQTFLLKVMDANDRLLMQKELKETTYTVKFAKPGAFKWSVQSSYVSKMGETVQNTSETRTLNLESVSRLYSGRDPVRDALMGKSSAFLYLEEGF